MKTWAQPATPARLLDRILERGDIRSAYQPIVDIETRAVVAYEALARGPEGSPLESPAALFGAAAKSGALAELEWACRGAAIQGALDADLGSRTSLFINVEPRIVGGVIPRELDNLLRIAGRKLRVVLELTERDLTRRPADLLRLVAWARDRWWGVALDDVGAEPESLALLPFVNPDVVKLDMRLVQEAATGEDEAVLEAVRDHCQRTGASILAEGIETEAQADRARDLGASLGQGWLYGRPGRLWPSRDVGGAVRLVNAGQGARSDETPFEAVWHEGIAVRRMRQSEAAARCREIEAQVTKQETGAVLLSSFGHAGLITPDIAQRYTALSENCLFTGVAGVRLLPDAIRGVRCTSIDAREELAREWAVTVVTPKRTHALLVNGVVRPEAGGDPAVEVIEVDDRDLVLAAARVLLARSVPA